ncbi:hypothetical protein [Ammoniphilus sp. YIM 78166]|uniref:hypothetical protein n=1 Tax=Ammoniphilus sp. YIM 78166 TaxID=1644106 RepID=UPI001430530A|nr:hypothetical protein [Ammoniphilus sp. YIM 78166]
MLDILFVITTLSLGAIFMSGPYLSFRTIKEDPFNKRMAMLRSLPIPVSVLSLSRMIMMLITLIVTSAEKKRTRPVSKIMAQGKQLGLSAYELRSIFNEVLEQHYDKEKMGDDDDDLRINDKEFD